MPVACNVCRALRRSARWPAIASPGAKPHTSIDEDQRRWSTAASSGDVVRNEEAREVPKDSTHRGRISTENDGAKSPVRRASRAMSASRADKSEARELSSRSRLGSTGNVPLRKVNQFSLSMHAVKESPIKAERDLGNTRRWQAMATAERKNNRTEALPLRRKFGADHSMSQGNSAPDATTHLPMPVMKRIAAATISFRPHSAGHVDVERTEKRSHGGERRVRATTLSSRREQNLRDRGLASQHALAKRIIFHAAQSKRHPAHYPYSKLPRRKIVRGFASEPKPSVVTKYIDRKIDPFRDDFQKILFMLANATPQFTTDYGDGLADLDSKFWESMEAADDNDVPGLENVLDDITYAPREEALRLRSQWSGPRETETGLALQRRPRYWTQPNFERYMRHLVSLGRQSHDNGHYVSGSSPATQEITSLLKDQKMVPHINQNCLNMALDHLCFQQCFRDVIHIFYRLQDHSYAFDAANFDRFLFAAAWHPTSLDFRPILEHMLESGFKPSGHTWYTFYQLIRRKIPIKRVVVLQMLRAKGLMKKDKNVKDALVRSLGWIEHSDLVPSRGVSWKPAYYEPNPDFNPRRVKPENERLRKGSKPYRPFLSKREAFK